MLNNIVRILTENKLKNGMFGVKLTAEQAQKELFRILEQPKITEILQRMKHN